MKTIVEFVKTTLAGGFLFLAPLVVALVLVREALRLGARLLAPVARLAHLETVVGLQAPYVMSALVLLGLCFAAGLVARTRIGRRVSEPLERVITRRVPGYTFVKAVTRGLAGLEAEGAEIRVALARIEDAWMLAFVLEQHADGLFTVFVPSAPTPAAGSVYYLTEDRLRPLDVSVTAALACIMRLGIGSRDLLAAAAARAR